MNFNMRNVWLVLMVALFNSVAFAQSIVTGRVQDNNAFPVSGANVHYVGQPNVKTITDVSGQFRLEIPSGKGILEIVSPVSGVREISFSIKEGETHDLGIVSLTGGDQINLNELVVVGKGVIDLAEDRKTPIANTVVYIDEIQAKAIGNVEFPEAIKNTPNVYVSNQTGGFGDSQMFMRGFDQSNTAFLLNGQPINGMEDGKMYWSNWAGIADISSAIDVQRGLGSSKLAISSVGGTVNIVTRATDLKRGGFVRFLSGYGSYFKGTVSYNTGLMDNGWGVSILLDYWQGWRNWAAGTAGAGQNYFLSIGKQIGDHNINFLVTGAPQWHDQNSSRPIDLYEKYGKEYNNNYGWYKGERKVLRKNYYHKPIINLNWDWNISNQASLSTVLYASFGRGGGTGDYGKGVGYIDNDGDKSTVGAYNFKTDGLIDWDYIIDNYNASISDGLSRKYNGNMLRASVNNHQWYGAVTNFSFDTQNNLSFNLGADFRFYNGDHFRQLVDLNGLKGRVEPNKVRANDHVVSATFKADPWASLFNFAGEGERVAYDNSEWINYQGIFGQAEYAVDAFSVFVQGAVSNQSYKKEDRWNSDHGQSNQLNRIGYNIKGGAAVNLGSNNTLYANAGYYSRQPFLDNVFEYGTIKPRDINRGIPGEQEVENEELTGFEAGYKAKWGIVNFALNTYYTKWANRFQEANGVYTPLNLDDAGFRLTNFTQVHKGVEIESNAKISRNWSLRGYFTYGDWRYDGSTPVDIIDNTAGDQKVIKTVNANLTGAYVGLAPQITFGMGTKFSFWNGFKIYSDLNFYGKLYGFVKIEDVVVTSLNNKVYQAERLADYATIDAGISYDFNFLKKKDLTLRFNTYNLLNTSYISQKNNYGYYFGKGRTWNASIQYKF